MCLIFWGIILNFVTSLCHGLYSFLCFLHLLLVSALSLQSFLCVQIIINCCMKILLLPQWLNQYYLIEWWQSEMLTIVWFSFTKSSKEINKSIFKFFLSYNFCWQNDNCTSSFVRYLSSINKHVCALMDDQIDKSYFEMWHKFAATRDSSVGRAVDCSCIKNCHPSVVGSIPTCESYVLDKFVTFVTLSLFLLRRFWRYCARKTRGWPL